MRNSRMTRDREPEKEAHLLQGEISRQVGCPRRTVSRMVKKIERVGKTRLAASTSLFGLPSPPSRFGRNLSDCQRQIFQKQTSGPRRWESVLAHTFKVARDSGIILWTAKMSVQVELASIRPVHEKPILRQLR